MNDAAFIAKDEFMKNAQGHLVPVNLVKPQDVLQDQTVNEVFEQAVALSAQIARFKGHTFEDIATFIDVLAERYGASKGGKKGNLTLTSFDGCRKITIQVQDSLSFGPELQIAKVLFDECISDWSKDSNDNIKTLVDHAFQVDKEGRINRAALFGLRRIEIDDSNWQSAIEALNDSIRIVGSREYIRFHKRLDPRLPWQAVTIDLASAVIPPPEDVMEASS